MAIYCSKRVLTASAGYRVFLDGEEIQGCYFADEEAGVALCYERGASGQFLAGSERHTPKVVLERGAVQVVPPYQVISRTGR